MDEKNDYSLQIKDIISESLIRDLVLFTLLFLLVVSQNWESILLLLFPLITFTFSLFFRIISSSKRSSEFRNKCIIYNPLGLEKKNANRLFFSAILQLILVFWLSSESLYNSHMVDNYYLYFIGLFIFIYSFGFFWIFIDIWKYTKIEIITTSLDDSKIQQYEIEFSAELNNIVAFLGLKYFKHISIINILVLLIVNIINVISIVLLSINPALGFQLSLPGSNNVGSEPLIVPFLFYGFLLISPLLTITLLVLNNTQISNFNLEKFNEIITSLPRNLQIKIVESLEALNTKMKEKLRVE